MDRVEITKILLDKSSMGVSELTNKLGVHRTSYYHWKDGYSTPRKSTLNKLAELLKVKLVWDGLDSVEIADDEVQVTNNQITIEGDKKVNMSANEILDIYRENRELRTEVDNLKNQYNEKVTNPESTHWENIEYDYISKVKLTRKKLRIGRTIESITNLDKQSKVLGYSEKELLEMWDLGVEHIDMANHPIDKIINEKTKKEIARQSLTLPIIFDAMKATLGDHYIPQPMVYIHKKGHSIGAVAYCKVNWSKMEVTAKVKFLTD